MFFLARTLAVLFFKNRLNNAEIQSRLQRALVMNAVPFLVFFLAFVFWTLFANGFAVKPGTNEVVLEPMKYMNNLIEMPVLLLLFLIGVVLVLYGIIKSYLNDSWRKGIWFAGAGTIITVTTLFLVAGYNNTAFYPSTVDLQSSLTIFNSSSSFFTLKIMSVVSLLIPFIAAYIFFAWRALEKTHTSIEEINEKDSHAY